MRFDFGRARPGADRVVSNLPYSVATPLILRTVEELPAVASGR